MSKPLLRKIALCLFFLSTVIIQAQVSSEYRISFENAIYHEADVEVNFKNIKSDTAVFRMSRSSPGRYALHEFAKNVYKVQVTDGKGKSLETFRTDPYSWNVVGHDGELNVSYTLFANHGDGTYSQIDKTHAHLNMPATFMFMEELENDGFEVTFMPRNDLNWKVATQLKAVKDNTYFAGDLQYFMDSPTEISDHDRRSFTIDENGKRKNIHFVLHDNKATEEDFNAYFGNVQKIVEEQKEVFGELPNFDFDDYIFIACYMPQVDGDGMEHRNSTILTSTRSIHGEGSLRNLGTVAHEFFHCWNVERIRPKSLKPFDFSKANMSGELWFAEGFTSYYDGLTLARAGIINEENYIKSIETNLNFVWPAAGRNFFNPIEMSYQAPFIDAAKSIDPTNKDNTYISYYKYGDMLGLALDLFLRTKGKSLDAYMKLVWQNYGKKEVGYTIADLQDILKLYTDKDFANFFFKEYIYDSKMPNLKPLFEHVGIDFIDHEKIEFGASLRGNEIVYDPKFGSSFYQAKLIKGDKIIKADDNLINSMADLVALTKSKSDKSAFKLEIEREGKVLVKTLPLIKGFSYELQIIPRGELTEEQIANKSLWLKSK